MIGLYFLLWPFLAGAMLFFLGKRQGLAQHLSLVANIVWSLLAIMLFLDQPIGTHEPLVLYSVEWLPAVKSHFTIGIDGISAPLIALNVLLSLLLAFYTLGKKSLGSAYLGFFMLLNGASVGALMALDLFLFYVFWEAMLIPMYFLIGRWGSANRVYATLKFFAFTMAGSLFMLLALVYIMLNPAVGSLQWHDLRQISFPFFGMLSPQGLLLMGFLAAFLVKVPMWPLHSWLPDAHTEAPTGASVILAGVLLKLGVYGLLRWCLPLFPEAVVAVAPIMITCAVLGVIVGSLAAWRQTDIKRVIAYSSVAHMAFMILGIFSFKVEAVQGALFQNIAHGLSTGALFLIFGCLYDRTHTREISKYGGLAAKNAFLTVGFVFAAMASIGLPGLPGFVGEFLILAGSFSEHPAAAMLASSGILFGAIYMLSLVRRVFFGKESALAGVLSQSKLSWSEYVAIVPLLLAMIFLGLQPNYILNLAEKAVNVLVSGVLR